MKKINILVITGLVFMLFKSNIQAGKNEILQRDIPLSCFVVHCEPTTATDSMFTSLQELVILADNHNVKLTIDLTPQWASMILDNTSYFGMMNDWQQNGHEIACHHHAYWFNWGSGSRATWDGYTNTSPDSLLENHALYYLGDMNAFMDTLNSLPGTRTSGCLGGTGHPNDEIDWPPELLYSTVGQAYEEAVSQPYQIDCNGYTVYEISHVFLYREAFAVDSLKTLYLQTSGDSVFNVITHVNNYESLPAPVELWFEFLWLQENSGESRKTVTEIMEEFLVPSSPTDVEIEIIENNAVLSWSAVETSIYEIPIEIDDYIIYYCNSTDSTFSPLGITTDTTFIHNNVCDLNDQMFYRITAEKQN
ncbi:MAG: hypothetical protein H8E57_02940 [Candidatus Cloacimonetes bacterium]|nr:hypothetical protein [Candidatus Cloacimonadota bacterium]